MENMPKNQSEESYKEYKKPDAENSEAKEKGIEVVFNEFDIETSSQVREKAPGKGEDVAVEVADSEKMFAAVMDGMGGQKGGGGDIAAKIVGEKMMELVGNKKDFPQEQKEVEDLMFDAATQAHEALKSNPMFMIHENMGTTLAAVSIYDNKATVVSSGDSRVYRLRNGKLEQVSIEDSVAGVLKSSGIEIDADNYTKVDSKGNEHDVTLEEAIQESTRVKPNNEFSSGLVDLVKNNMGKKTLKQLRNVNISAMSATEATSEESKKIKEAGLEDWKPHITTVDVQSGDEFIVASDGLFDSAPNSMIENGLNEMHNVNSLIDAMNDNNINVKDVKGVQGLQGMIKELKIKASYDTVVRLFKSAKERDMKAYSSEEITQNLVDFATDRQDKSKNPDANKPDDISIVHIGVKKSEAAVARDKALVDLSEEQSEQELANELKAA